MNKVDHDLSIQKTNQKNGMQEKPYQNINVFY